MFSELLWRPLRFRKRPSKPV